MTSSTVVAQPDGDPEMPATILATAYPAAGKERGWEQAISELIRTSRDSLEILARWCSSRIGALINTIASSPADGGDGGVVSDSDGCSTQG